MDAGQLTGNLLALGVSVCFAAQLTVLRKFHATVDMLPMVMIAGLWTLVPAFVLAGPFAATGTDLAWLLLMGSVQLGIGCLLATAASRTLPANELGLLALLEPILGPHLGVGADGRAARTERTHRRRHRALRRHREPDPGRLARAQRRRRRAAARSLARHSARANASWRCPISRRPSIRSRSSQSSSPASPRAASARVPAVSPCR